MIHDIMSAAMFYKFYKLYYMYKLYYDAANNC